MEASAQPLPAGGKTPTAEGPAGEGRQGPDAPPQSDLEATFWRADDLFQQGAFAEAAALFTKAFELSQMPGVSETWRQFSPHIAFNVAHSHRGAGNCEAARMAFAHYEGLVHTLPAEHRDWHQGLLDECPSLRAADPKAAPQGQDGNVGDMPPRSSVTAALSNEPPPTGSWLLDVNTKQTPPSDPSATDAGRIAGWGSAGVAVAAVAVAGALWVSADDQQDLADRTRLWAEAERYQNAANSRRVASAVLMGVGAALAGTSVYLLTRSSPTPRPQQTVVRALAVGITGTNISLWGQF